MDWEKDVIYNGITDWSLKVKTLKLFKSENLFIFKDS